MLSRDAATLEGWGVKPYADKDSGVTLPSQLIPLSD